MSKAKAIWESYGEHDPYYAVLTEPEFRAENLNAEAIESFFDRGRRHLDEVWAEFERAAGCRLSPDIAIDYGCGVGRVLIPLSRRCKSVIGVDISNAMLEGAMRNASAAGRTNITFQNVDEFDASAESRYDLIHTFIVLQHVRPAIGYAVIDTLLRRLTNGGFGMIHVTFASNGPRFTRLRSLLYRDVPGLHKLLNLLRGRDQQCMPMYEYDLKRVQEVFARNGSSVIGERDTDHGFFGKMYFLRKDRAI